MTPEEFENKVNGFIPVLNAEFQKRGGKIFGVERIRPDEFLIKTLVPAIHPNGETGWRNMLFTVWFVKDKIDWCEGVLPQFAPKDI